MTDYRSRTALRVVASEPPYELVVERKVIGSCTHRPEYLEGLELAGHDFYVERHSVVWDALQWLRSQGRSIDTLAVHDRLEAIGKIQAVGGLEGLVELTDVVPEEPSSFAARLRELSAMRDAHVRMQRAQTALASHDVAGAREALAAGVELLVGRSMVTWRSTSEIFAPLPEPRWIARGLHIGPGRPSLLAGYGASAKTLSAQQLSLAVAAGVPAWEHFDTSVAEVRHLDYEQGWHATARRYQRLAIGHRIDPRELGDRLKLAIFPSVFLDSQGAVDAYARLCEGAGLVILDALRGATPTQDENDSSIRACLDNLSRVSEKTGAAFVVLHHAGKPKDGHSDARTVARGSSAIFDACGCVFVVTPGKSKDDPRKVAQVKQPAEAEGGALEDFCLNVEDFTVGTNPTAGVRVVHRSLEAEDAEVEASAKYERDAARLLDAIRATPGISQKILIEKSAMGRTRAGHVLGALEEQGRLHVTLADRGAKTYRVLV